MKKYRVATTEGRVMFIEAATPAEARRKATHTYPLWRGEEVTTVTEVEIDL